MWETRLEIVLNSVTEKELLTFSKTPKERGTLHPNLAAYFCDQLGQLHRVQGSYCGGCTRCLPIALYYPFICKFLNLNFIPIHVLGGWRRPVRIWAFPRYIHTYDISVSLDCELLTLTVKGENRNFRI